MSKSTRTTRTTSIATRTVVSEAVHLEFSAEEGEATGMDAELLFDPADPYAVTVVFKAGSTDVRWTFARDLLIEGAYEPSGDGDVHVWPCLSTEGSAVTIIELSSPDGEILVQTCSRGVHRFLNRVLASVPQGAESDLVDLDAAVAGLLGA